MQLDVALLSGRPDLGEARHLARRRDEARVAAPAVAALRENDTRARVCEVGDQVALVGEHLCADRDAQLGVVAVGAVLARAATVATALRLDPLAPLQRREVAQRGIGEQHDVAAVAAVAAVRAALGDELLPAERQTAVAALPGLNVQLRAVTEHRRTVAGSAKGRPRRDMSRGQTKRCGMQRSIHRQPQLSVT